MAHPFDRAVEAPPRFLAMPQAVMGHGLEEKVKPIELTLPGREALREGRHRLGILPRPVEDDSPRVEVNLLTWGQLDGPETQLQRAVDVLVRRMTRIQQPGQVIAALGQELPDLAT